MKKSLIAIATLTALTALTGCVAPQEKSTVIQPTQTVAAQNKVNYQGVKVPVSVGKFDNRSSYMKGIFSDNADRLGSQAKTILEGHLQQSGYFSVLNRDNLSELAQESGYTKTAQNIKGAKYVITGDVTEFGRKEVGDHQLFGLLGQGKSQVAYAKVVLNVINTQTSEIIYSSQGAGQFQLDNREVLGFGSTASYDATLNGKVLDLAIRQAVDELTNGVSNGNIK